MGGMLRGGGGNDFETLSVTQHSDPCVCLGTSLETLLRENSGCCRQRDVRLHSQTEDVTKFGRQKQHFGGRRVPNNERVELAVREWLIMNIRKEREGHIVSSGVPRNFVQGGGSTNSVEDRGQRERGSGGGSTLVRGFGGSCNLVREISLHIVK